MLDGGATNDRYRPREFSSTRTVERGKHAGPSAGYRPSGDRASSPPGQHRAGQHRRQRGKDPGPANGKRGPFWRELLIIVVAAAALTLVVKSFVVQVYKIPSVSMDNTLAVGDRVLVNRLVYHFRPIARGDVIVFSGQDSWGPDAPPGPSDPVLGFFQDALSDIGLYSSQTYYIKRVIGLPGDHVACCTDGKVTVNGVPLEETSFCTRVTRPRRSASASSSGPGTCGSWGTTAATPGIPATTPKTPATVPSGRRPGGRPGVHDHLAAVSVDWLPRLSSRS